jgi:hypothetical protein
MLEKNKLIKKLCGVKLNHVRNEVGNSKNVQISGLKTSMFCI